MSWKHSFKRLNEEYEIANKKKQALDNLFETGRISQSTRDSFNDEIDAAMADIEKQQKELLAKMQFKMRSLETQIKTLETLLANYEIQHVVGEIEEETYQRETALLSRGLETAKHELDVIIDAINQICPPTALETEATSPLESDVPPTIEVPSVENVTIAPAEVEASTDPCPQEPAITLEETAPAPEQPVAEAEDTAPVETASEEITEEVSAEAIEVTEEIPQESAIPMEDVSPENEPPHLETEETVPVETSEAAEEISQEPDEILDEAVQVETSLEENTDEVTVEAAPEATDDVTEEAVIITEEAAPQDLSAENEDAQTEVGEVTESEFEEDISEEPLITVEDAAPEIEQPLDESEDVLIIEAPQLVDDGSEAVEAVVPEANPQDAPQEAQPEMTAEEAQPEETTAEETTAEETTAEETTAESFENQEE